MEGLAVADGVAAAELEAELMAEPEGTLDGELEEAALEDALNEAESDGPTGPDADAPGGADAVLAALELLPGDWLLAGELGATRLRSIRKSYVGTVEAHQGDSDIFASPNWDR